MRSLVAVVLVCSGVVLAQDVPAAAKKWSWSEEKPSLEQTANKLLPEFTVAVVASDTIEVKKGQKVVLEVPDREPDYPGSRTQALARSTDTLLVARYCAIATGCAVTAYDLASGRKLWSTRLEGLGPISHEKYYNRVQMTVIQDVLVVRGWEAAARYIECVSVETGKTVYHEKLGR